MIGERRVIAIIVARGGSKGLPGKNTMPCGGKPLIAWSVAAAKGSMYVDRVLVSSDDERILELAREAGAEVAFVRPAALASDEASITDVVLHALTAVGEQSGIGVLLQATSPLRLAEDVDGVIDALDRNRAHTAVSVTESPKSPLWMHTIDADGRLRSLLPNIDGTRRRRQDLPPVYVLNGAVYAFDVSRFQKERRFVIEGGTVAYVMPAERSVDVDSALDLAVAEVLFSRRTQP